MTFSLTWLPDTLQLAGLKVAETDGWRTRGKRDMGKVEGVICHHTGGLPPGKGSMTSLKTLVNGRPGLSGPLSQLGLGRDGTYYVIAAGVANHAGKGHWKGKERGNSSFIGIEAENSGQADDAWPEVQIDAFVRGVAAILKRIGADAIMCASHHEWAPGRKNDPSFTAKMGMDDFRSRVRAVMQGTANTRGMIPASSIGQSKAVLPTLRRSDSGRRVLWLQEKLGLPVSAQINPRTEAEIRAFQRQEGLVDDGIVGPRTWAALEKRFGHVPA